MKNHKYRRTQGFSLVELLTAIAVLSIIATILLLTANKVQQAARTSQCVSNIRQLGIAVLLKTQADGLVYPNAYEEGVANNFWYRSLNEYLDSTTRPDDLFFCNEEAIQPNEADRKNRSNYISNRSLFNDAQPRGEEGAVPDRISVYTVKRPSEVVMLADGAVNARGFSDHSAFRQTGHAVTNPARADTPLPNDNNGSTNACISWRHQGRTNVVFADGHTATVRLGDLYYRNLQVAY